MFFFLSVMEWSDLHVLDTASAKIRESFSFFYRSHIQIHHFVCFEEENAIIHLFWIFLTGENIQNNFAGENFRNKFAVEKEWTEFSKVNRLFTCILCKIVLLKRQTIIVNGNFRKNTIKMVKICQLFLTLPLTFQK